MPLTLYSHPFSSYCQKVLIALWENDTPFTYRHLEEPGVSEERAALWPLGRFPVLEKDADHVSNLYDAPMPYMLRLTGDGVAIHGSTVEWGLATHGCIGVPVEFARLLFGAVGKGDLVIVTKGELLKLGDRIA